MRTGRYLWARRQLYRIQYAEVGRIKAMPARCIHHKAHPGAVRRAVRLNRRGTGGQDYFLEKRVVPELWTR